MKIKNASDIKCFEIGGFILLYIRRLSCSGLDYIIMLLWWNVLGLWFVILMKWIGLWIIRIWMWIVSRYFQKYFSYVVVVIFDAVGDWSTRVKNEQQASQVSDNLCHIMLLSSALCKGRKTNLQV